MSGRRCARWLQDREVQPGQKQKKVIFDGCLCSDSAPAFTSGMLAVAVLVDLVSNGQRNPAASSCEQTFRGAAGSPRHKHS
ncbi:UNVERIFIED_CONTAM: hypothetical protein HHA_214070 [Hammondia hammondi]|eukprot:XP_008885393.1 hypothetical protein HHA_214070 [Hammondia hammondi]